MASRTGLIVGMSQPSQHQTIHLISAQTGELAMGGERQAGVRLRPWSNRCVVYNDGRANSWKIRLPPVGKRAF
jgi:hypothetical protein